MTNEIKIEQNLIAYCGLYCGACKAYLNGNCLGCVVSPKNTRCNVKKCNISKGQKSCADCTEYENIRNCKNLNNFISKIFGLLFKSDRLACLKFIKEKGYQDFAGYMSKNKIHTIKKN